MPRLELLCMTPDVIDDIAHDRMREARRADPGELSELVKEIARVSEDFRASKSLPFEWAGHLAIDADQRLIIGTCAFKGGPELEDGAVEIAYFTFPPYEGKGYATAMAAALIERARAWEAVRLVFAYTAPGYNASTSVLTKLGFAFKGEVNHPEDGLVWCWELPMR